MYVNNAAMGWIWELLSEKWKYCVLNGEQQPSYLDGLVEYGRDFVVVVAIACSRHDRGETRINWNSEGEGNTSE